MDVWHCMWLGSLVLRIPGPLLRIRVVLRYLLRSKCGVYQLGIPKPSPRASTIKVPRVRSSFNIKPKYLDIYRCCITQLESDLIRSIDFERCHCIVTKLENFGDIHLGG